MRSQTSLRDCLICEMCVGAVAGYFDHGKTIVLEDRLYCPSVKCGVARVVLHLLF